ncbi:MAG: MAPEG family protein [Rhodospirillaceae bacterium]
MDTIALPVTLVTASILALMCLLLAARVSGARLKHRISLGDRGNEELLVRMRIHGNFVEFVPFVLILMALLELTGADRSILIAAGAILVLSRISHMIGMPRPAPNLFRAGGATGTYLLMAGLAVWGLARGLAA